MASLKYTGPDVTERAGWLYKAGQNLGFRTKRFIKLQGSTLSNHYDESSPPTWQIDIFHSDLDISEKYKMFTLVTPDKSKTLTFYAETEEDFQEWSVAFKRATATCIEDFYEIGDVIGVGAYGKVFQGTDRICKEKRAIKVLKKNFNDQRNMNYLRREVRILLAIDNPNVIRTFDIFDSPDRLYFVMEFLPGGELFDIIANENHFAEPKARDVMGQILNGVAHLHSHNIVHRDIKPENILSTRASFPLEVKLTDFGLSNFVEDTLLASYVGTPYYLAPEIYRKQQYGFEVDLWACGVVLYILLSGKFPFWGKSEHEYWERVYKGVKFPPREWEDVSDEAKDLVSSMLNIDPKRRPTAANARNHAWFQVKEETLRHAGSSLRSFHSSMRESAMGSLNR
eukprot:CAMPEP_0198317226 /NCGR_PEP_ID=MMETSP1450-20131203/6777_1 /TAXON_ID=753684 ORGANISM="Madagascaria erythrocladiodes, Strain CCMP3234" /NCGR_SAMPLE_ID=MMETSP1450 /ASSEMBLY_ACC=CAM_ASM_001115 /LENGTH=396 /DNA_ID=CAMNT_0044020415 /DNA_START=190 /DNA_END=1380 /DNA_ORIENTATION=+